MFSISVSGLSELELDEHVKDENINYISLSFSEFSSIDDLKAYIKVPDLSEALPNEKYQKSISGCYILLMNFISKDIMPSEPFVKKYIKLFSAAPGRKENTAFLSYKTSGKEIMIVWTYKDEDKLYVFIRDPKLKLPARQSQEMETSIKDIKNTYVKERYGELPELKEVMTQDDFIIAREKQETWNPEPSFKIYLAEHCIAIYVLAPSAAKGSPSMEKWPLDSEKSKK